MWATLAFATALSLAPSQGAASTTGQLRLSNVRSTYGYMGPTRPDNSLLPGEMYFVSFDIDGLQVGDDNKVLYSTGIQLLNSQGKAEFTQDPTDLEAINSLGGTSMPGFANVNVGTDTTPGKYTLKVSVTDRRTKKTESLTRDFEVLPKNFGLVRTELRYILQNLPPAPPILVTGQAIVVNCSALYFQRDNQTMQPNVGLEIRVLDEKGNPAAKPVTDEVTKGLPANQPNIPISFPLQLNRSGKFTIEVQATDRVAKKTAGKVSFAIQVYDPK